jgi:hypothetical protein
LALKLNIFTSQLDFVGDAGGSIDIGSTVIVGGTPYTFLVENAANQVDELGPLSNREIFVGVTGSPAGILDTDTTGDIIVDASTGLTIKSGVITNSEIDAAANISRTKLNSGSADRLVINDALGVMTDAAAITASRALVSNASGIPTHSAVTTTELGYVSGVTSAIQTQLNAKENSANKGIAGGYASLDGAGKVPVSQLPNSIMEYQGTWNASTNTPTLADGAGSIGDVYRVSVAGTQNLGSGSISFDVGDYAILNASLVWEKADTTDAVSSVNGLTGAVVLTTTNISEGTNLYYTDERAQDAVGNILLDTSTIDLTYNDGTPSISAAIVAGSISNTHIATGAAIDATKIADGSVSSTEFQYLSNVTSDIQTQINNKFTLPALTSGSVLFSDGTTIAQDNANLFYDNTNDRLGVGITTPQSKLHVDGGTGNATFINITNGATTGQASTDGFSIGISATGVAQLRQRENSDFNFFTNNQQVFLMRANGSVAVQNNTGTQLATTATGGFLYIPSSAGTPTGVPSTINGTVPIEIDTTNSKPYFYNAGWISMMTPSSTDTLTNKTFNADGTGNSITNIENADIKAGAAIDATKIAAGTVDNTEFGYLDGVTSAIQTQLNNKANQSLSNLTNPTSINQHLIPDTDSSWDIGSSTKNWVDGHFAGVLATTGNTVVVDMGARQLKTSTSSKALDFSTDGQIVTSYTVKPETTGSDNIGAFDKTYATGYFEVLNDNSDVNVLDTAGRVLYDSTGAAVIDFSTDIDATSHNVINVLDPVNAQDAATKNYVDSKFNPNDISETLFLGADNQATPADVTGFVFSNAAVRAFDALVSVYVDATSDLYETFKIQGIQRGADWVINYSSVGDSSGVVFSITTSGQIQYTSSTYAGFTSMAIKFRADTLGV